MVIGLLISNTWHSGLVMLMIIEQMQLCSRAIGSKLKCCMIHCITCTIFALRGSAVVAIHSSSHRVVCGLYSICYTLFKL